MGILKLFKKKKSKKELLAWQRILTPDSPRKLIMTESQLSQFTCQQAGNDLRVIEDCLKIIFTTTKPDTFFSRLDLLKEKAKHLVMLEPYWEYEGASPTAAYQEVIDQEQDAIRAHIDECYYSTFKKAEKLKTEKGKKNQFRKVYEELLLYQDRMSQSNINYLERKFKQQLEKEIEK